MVFDRCAEGRLTAWGVGLGEEEEGRRSPQRQRDTEKGEEVLTWIYRMDRIEAEQRGANESDVGVLALAL